MGNRSNKVIKDDKALKEKLTPAAAVAYTIVPIPDNLSTKYGLPSTPNLTQTSQCVLAELINSTTRYNSASRPFHAIKVEKHGKRKLQLNSTEFI